MKHWCVSINHVASESWHVDRISCARRYYPQIYVIFLYMYERMCMRSLETVRYFYGRIQATQAYSTQANLSHPSGYGFDSEYTDNLVEGDRILPRDRSKPGSRRIDTSKYGPADTKREHRFRFYQSERINMHVCTSPRIKGTDCNIVIYAYNSHA